MSPLTLLPWIGVMSVSSLACCLLLWTCVLLSRFTKGLWHAVSSGFAGSALRQGRGQRADDDGRLCEALQQQLEDYAGDQAHAVPTVSHAGVLGRQPSGEDLHPTTSTICFLALVHVLYTQFKDPYNLLQSLSITTLFSMVQNRCLCSPESLTCAGQTCMAFMVDMLHASAVRGGTCQSRELSQRCDAGLENDELLPKPSSTRGQ